jgi:hypothetical protein
VTEEEWLVSEDVNPMLLHIRVGTGVPDRRLGGHRKLRLFNSACCRRIDHLLPDQVSRTAVEVAERYADAQATADELAEAWHDAHDARLAAYQQEHNSVAGYAGWAATYAASDRYMDSATNCGIAVYLAAGDDQAAGRREATAQVALLRDVFGNPFRPMAFDPEWRTTTAVALARGMYDARSFSHMPVLADALEDAGCNHPEVLAHCRSDRQHVRGCWVVDLLLGTGEAANRRNERPRV